MPALTELIKAIGCLPPEPDTPFTDNQWLVLNSTSQALQLCNIQPPNMEYQTYNQIKAIYQTQSQEAFQMSMTI